MNTDLYSSFTRGPGLLSIMSAVIAFALATQYVNAADVTVQPAAGSGFVVKDASGANDRLRVQETGAIAMPGVPAAPTQTQGLCIGAAGQLGLCSGTGSGGSYTAGTGLALAGTAFSVAPTYQLPQACTVNQVAQWSGTAWVCSSAGGTLPTGTVNQTLRYDMHNALSTNSQLLAFSDGGLLAGGLFGSGNSIPITGAGTRMMWYPAKAAFRVGNVDSTQWDDANVGGFSVAMGFDTMAKGDSSIAAGHLSVATGPYAIALGDTANASSLSSIAIGTRTSASGPSSIALGVNTKASGDSSTAMGFGTTASGLVSTAIGNGTTATGESSTTMGSGTRAAGGASTAMGAFSYAGPPAGAPTLLLMPSSAVDGDYATAIGFGTVSKGIASTAMGALAIASGKSSIAMGHFTIASGDDSTAMGIAADTKKHINSFVYGDGSGTGEPTMNDNIYQFMVRASGGFKFYTGAAPDTTTGIQLAGGNSSWTTLSDRNAKTAVVPVDARAVLAKVAAMPLNTWQYKTQDAKYRHMGPMAQDFYAAFQLGESDKGIDTVDADGVALAAIQGLRALLKDKDAEIAALRSELAAQKNELVAQKRETQAQQARLAALASLAGDVAEMKARLAALRTPPPAPIEVALRQP